MKFSMYKTKVDWTLENLELMKFTWIELAEHALREKRTTQTKDIWEWAEQYDKPLNDDEKEKLDTLWKKIKVAVSYGYHLDKKDLCI